MKKSVGLGIIVLIMVLMVSPVVAWHAIVTKSGPVEVCTSCDSVSYTLDATSAWDLYKLEITDTLPHHLVYDSVTSSRAEYTVDTSHAGKVIITEYNVTKNTPVKITLVLKPDVTDPPVAGGQIVNTVASRVKGCGAFNAEGQCINRFWSWEGSRSLTNNPEGSILSVTTTFSDSVCPIPSPEFPTMAVPATLIIGLLGAVLFIRTREN
jgi:hypothetical protein